MPLKFIAGNAYFYRSRRINGRVVSEYLGAGERGYLDDQLNKYERQKTRQRRAALKELQKREAALDRQINEIGEILEVVAAAMLLTNGFHQHKRQWRKAKK